MPRGAAFPRVSPKFALFFERFPKKKDNSKSLGFGGFASCF